MKDTAPPHPQTTPAAPPTPTIGFDWTDWLPHLAESDLPDDQKQALIEALWSIILAFVDLGFDVKAPAEICGQAIDLKAVLAADMVISDDAQTDESEAT
ncbi:MAG: hypothetical protein AAF376_19980 [Pseudomonadota bacterium]